MWGCRQGADGDAGVEGEEGILCAATAALFQNLTAYLCSPFLILDFSLLPGEFCYQPLFIRFSAIPMKPRFLYISCSLCSPLNGNPYVDNRTDWNLDRGRGPWHQAGRLCLSAAWYDYKSCAQACGGSGCVCEVSLWMKTEAPCFPPAQALHILTKESHSVGQTVTDTCDNCTLFIPLSFFPLFTWRLSLPSAT